MATTGEAGEAAPTKTKEEIQAELTRLRKQLERVEAEEKKQRSQTRKVLAPASPSPSPKKNHAAQISRSSEKTASVDASKSLAVTRNASSITSGNQNSRSGSSNQTNKVVEAVERKKSNLIEDLEAVRQESKNQTILQTTKRSHDFETRSERVSAPATDLRGLDLTIKINIRMGPITFRPRKNDANFVEYEPNSQTRLSKRLMNHEALQDHLSDRYVVQINELYAIIKKIEVGRFQSGHEWTIPLVGDWVLFGVIAQKSDFKTTNPYISSQFNRINNNNQNNNHTQEEEASSPSSSKKRKQDKHDLEDLNEQLEREEGNKPGVNNQLDSKKLEPPPPEKKQGKKFVTFKLIDMSSSKRSNSGSGMINMILFESDSYIPNGQENNNKTYRGGSGGAYETFWKEQPGTLIGILNPKILKSRRPTTGGPPLPSHAGGQFTTEILTITPENAKSLIVIGKCKDLGTCVAKRLDTGKPCGSWCDLRTCNSGNSVSSLAVCDFHLQRQVGKVRAGRAEFFAGTSGMNTHTGKKFGTEKYDAESKTGLLPSQRKMTSINGQKTYICGGGGGYFNPNHDIKKKMTFRDRFSEPIDTEKLEGMKLKRKRELEERAMNQILNQQIEKKDNYGLKCIQDAKKLASSSNHQNKSSKTVVDDVDQSSLEPADPKNSSETKMTEEKKSSGSNRRVFSTAAIRAIGFDPFQSSSKGFQQKKTTTSTSEDREKSKSSSIAYDHLLNSIHNNTKKSKSLNYQQLDLKNPLKFKQNSLVISPDDLPRNDHDGVDPHQQQEAEGKQLVHLPLQPSSSSQSSSFKKIKLDVPALIKISSSLAHDDDDGDLIIQPEKTS